MRRWYRQSRCPLFRGVPGGIAGARAVAARSGWIRDVARRIQANPDHSAGVVAYHLVYHFANIGHNKAWLSCARDSHRQPATNGNPQSPALYNEDLALPERNWGTFSIFNVWTSDVHSLWGYYLAASLFLLCGSFTNFLLAIGLGSLVIFVLMNLIGWAGEKTGVPYPVLARASFGIWGANLPAIVRAIVAHLLVWRADRGSSLQRPGGPADPQRRHAAVPPELAHAGPFHAGGHLLRHVGPCN